MFIITQTKADDAVQFNTDVLDVNDRSHIDLKQFSQAGYLMPDKYQMVLRINKNELPEQTIEFLAPDNDPQGSLACLTSDMVNSMGLKESSKRTLTWWHNNQCLDPASLKGMTLRPDLGSGTLYVTVPQAYLEYTADNWDPPSQWDNGIPGILLDYNVNVMETRQQGSGQNQNVSGNGTTGVNFGPWRLRADWQGQYNHTTGESGSSRSNWDWSRFYAYRAITALKAKLIVGENSLNSGMFDSFRYTGASLITDDNMLPPNLRGYAPEVTGVAKTNAKVTISQQGRVIYETSVVAGPFRIQDLNTAVTGKLDVNVQEQDGSTQTFQVDM